MSPWSLCTGCVSTFVILKSKANNQRKPFYQPWWSLWGLLRSTPGKGEVDKKKSPTTKKNLPTNNNINERILWKPTTATKKDLAINNNTISTWPARWWNCSPHADQTHYSFSNTGLGLFLMIENFINRCWFCDLQTSSALPLPPECPVRAPVCVLATSLAILGAVRGTWISAWTRGGWERVRSSLKSLIIQICCIIMIIISPIGRSAPL